MEVLATFAVMYGGLTGTLSTLSDDAEELNPCSWCPVGNLVAELTTVQLMYRDGICAVISL